MSTIKCKDCNKTVENVHGHTLRCNKCDIKHEKESTRLRVQKHRDKNKKQFTRIRGGEEDLPVGMGLDGVYRPIDKDILETHGDIPRTHERLSDPLQSDKSGNLNLYGNAIIGVRGISETWKKESNIIKKEMRRLGL